MSDSNESAARQTPTRIRLSAACGIREAGDLKRALMALLDASETVTIDAAAVQRVDTAALQLLFAFAHDRAKRGHPLEWSGVSAGLSDAAAMLGVPLGSAAASSAATGA